MILTVLRHSTAHKAGDLNYFADIARRTLTHEGVALAIQRRRMLDKPAFELVVSSPALRAVQTAGVVAGFDANNIGNVCPMDALCYGNPADGGDAQTLDQLFRKLEYAPLADYLKYEQEHQKQEDGKVIERTGLAGWQAVRNFAGRARAENVLAVGHAVLINALGYEAVTQSDHRRMLADANFGECEGFILTLDKNHQATDLQLLN